MTTRETAWIKYDKLLRESDKAICVKLGDETRWIPKSLIVDNDYAPFIELPLWFVEREGLEGYCEETP